MISLGDDHDDYLPTTGADRQESLAMDNNQAMTMDEDVDFDGVQPGRVDRQRGTSLNFHHGTVDSAPISAEREASTITARHHLTQHNPIAMYKLPEKKAKTGLGPMDWYMSYENPIEIERAAKLEREAKSAADLDRIAARIKAAQAEHVLVHEDDTKGEMENNNQRFEGSKPCLFHDVPIYSEKEYIGINSPDKENRYYITEAIESHSVPSSSHRSHNLLSDFDRLLEEANMINRQRFARSTEMMDVTNSVSTSNDLWVDKYRPKAFIDLLTDDSVNRCVITWLKLWDECVFHRKAPPPPIQPITVTDVGGEKGDKPWMKNNKKEKFVKWRPRDIAAEIPTNLDKHKRPEHKIVLICGPPGLGKTTLAHVVSAKCGYNVVEMNASDDRQLSAFEERIQGAMASSRSIDQIHAGVEAKPTCLVIDECDGAPVTSINYLVALAKDAIGKKKRKTILKRPIVCVCNDLYTPALRELRKVALVLQMPQTTTARMCQRLNNICLREHLSVEPRALDALCTKTGADVRSAINYLQFVQSTPTHGAEHSRYQVRTHDVQKSDVGDKDSQQSLLELFKTVFQLPRQAQVALRKRPRICRDGTVVMDETPLTETELRHARLSKLMKDARSVGDDERVANMIWENCCQATKGKQPFDNLVATLTYQTFTDVTHKLMMSTQAFELYAYGCLMPRVAHIMLASTANQGTMMVYPRMAGNIHQTMERNSTTLTHLCSGNPTVRALNSRQTLLRDTLYYLTILLAPKLKPMNSQLYSAAERAELQRVVDAMLHYNIGYRQQLNAETVQYEFVYEPDFTTLASYEGGDKSQNILSFGAKQMINRELEVERMRRAELANSGVAPPTSSLPAPSTPIAKPKLPATSQSTQHARTPGGRKAAPMFFQSTAKTLEIHREKTSTASLAMERRKAAGALWYRYVEGYSNAVRKTVRVKDFL